MLKYANSKKRSRISRLAGLLAIIVMVPAIWTFLNVFKESRFDNQITKFMENEIKPNPALQLMNFDKDFEGQALSLNFFNEISEATKQDLLNELSSNPEYPNLRQVKLQIKGSDTKSYELISNAYQDARDELKESKNVVSGLQLEIEDLKGEITELNQEIEQASSKNNEVAFSSLARDAKIRFNDLQYFSYAKMLESNDFIKVDTVTVANVKWNSSLSDSLVVVKEKLLSDWLKQELKTENIIIKHN